MLKEEKIFPLLLGRKGGGGFVLLDKIRVPSTELQLKNLLLKKKDLENVKNKVIKNIHGYINLVEENDVKRILLNYKRDVFNNRNIDSYETILINYKNLKKDFDSLKFIRNSCIEEEGKFKLEFEKELYSSIHCLKNITNKHFFKNGILFSSKILYNQINKSDYKFLKLNKKNRKLITSTLKYLTRSITKTTPYSSFNNIFCLKKNNDVFNNEISDNYSSFQLLNLFFHSLKLLLLEKEEFKKKLIVTLNQTIKYEGNNIVYFINHNNTESFKKINDNKVLDFIKKVLSFNGVVFNDLLFKLLDATGDSKENVINYINTLIKEGVLIIKYPVSHSNPLWIKEIKSHVEGINFSDIKFKKNLLNLINYVLIQIEKIEDDFDVMHREEIIRETFNKLVVFFDDYSKTIDFVSNVKERDLFFEDTISNIDINIRVNTIREINKRISDLYCSFNRLLSQKKEFKIFLSSFIKKNDKINILDFYENIYLKEYSNFKIDHNVTVNLNSVISNAIKSIKSSIEIETIDISKFFNKRNLDETKGVSFGAYIQTENHSFNKVVINNFSKGRGANISRFLTSFPIDYSNLVKDYNESNDLLHDVKDASINNVNVFHPLSKSVISVNEDLALSNNYNIVHLKNIFVGFNKLGELALFNEKDVEVSLTRLSLENLKRRSKFTQFIDVFDNEDSTSYNIFLGTINHSFRNLKDDIISIPRLIFGNQLILQRKKWFVKKDYLLNIINRDSLMDSYISINTWVEKNNIPNEVFIKIEDRDLEKNKNDNYKPQYIDFRSSVFILLMMSLINNAEDVIEITEMYPTSSNIKMGDGYVKEFVLNIN